MLAAKELKVCSQKSSNTPVATKVVILEKKNYWLPNYNKIEYRKHWVFHRTLGNHVAEAAGFLLKLNITKNACVFLLL